MNGLVHDLNTLEIMIIRMIWIINLKNMMMIDIQSLNAAHLFDDIDTNSSSDSPVKKS